METGAEHDYEGGNARLVVYTWGQDLSASREGAGGIGGLLARSDQYSSGSMTRHACYFADGNGNIVNLINAAAAHTVWATYRYNPYGATTYSNGTLASANVYRFSSKECIPNAGIYYYGFRFYEPNLQRWINRDPIGERGSINMYEYAEGNPVSAVDPHGLCSQADIDALAVSLGRTYELPTRFTGEEFCGILCCDCSTGKPYAAPVQMGKTVPMGPGQPSWKVCSTANSKCRGNDPAVGRWHTHPAGSDRQIDPEKDYNLDLAYPRQTNRPSYMTNSKGETTVIWPVGGYFPEIVIDPPARRKHKRL